MKFIEIEQGFRTHIFNDEISFLKKYKNKKIYFNQLQFEEKKILHNLYTRGVLLRKKEGKKCFYFFNGNIGEEND